jgi:hypothetical protein
MFVIDNCASEVCSAFFGSNGCGLEGAAAGGRVLALRLHTAAGQCAESAGEQRKCGVSRCNCYVAKTHSVKKEARICN